jgi:hypothetical protein
MIGIESYIASIVMETLISRLPVGPALVTHVNEGRDEGAKGSLTAGRRSREMEIYWSEEGERAEKLRRLANYNT